MCFSVWLKCGQLMYLLLQTTIFISRKYAFTEAELCTPLDKKGTKKIENCFNERFTDTEGK